MCEGLVCVCVCVLDMYVCMCVIAREEVCVWACVCGRVCVCVWTCGPVSVHACGGGGGGGCSRRNLCVDLDALSTALYLFSPILRLVHVISFVSPYYCAAVDAYMLSFHFATLLRCAGCIHTVVSFRHPAALRWMHTHCRFIPRCKAGLTGCHPHVFHRLRM